MTDTGITATREGLTQEQKQTLMEALSDHFVEGARFHHGDCIGGDYEAGLIAAALRYWIVLHPPKNNKARAFSVGDETLPPKEYHHRNRDIVRESGLLLVCPKEDHIVPKGTRGSGTWSTYWRAVDSHKPTLIIWPDGEMKYSENEK